MQKHLSSLFFGVLLLVLGISCVTMADSWKFGHQDVLIEIDTGRNGQITRWQIGSKTFINTVTSESPLILESEDGQKYFFTAAQTISESESVRIHGHLSVKGQNIPATISYRIEEEGKRIRAAIQFENSSSSPLIGELSWALPLALEPRKRVWFRGDHGLEWDTRYFYQFMAGTVLNPLTRPDRNEWRYFGLDQLSSRAFRLWKSESEQTSPLMMQEGTVAVPAVQLYNADGGITVEYPALNKGTSRSLRVDAAEGGEVKVLFQSKSTPAAKLGQMGLFGAAHEIILTAQNSEESALEKQKELARAYPAAPRPTAQQALEEDQWLRETPLGAARQYVTGGYPFAPGELRDASAVRVSVGGQNVPVQAKPTAFWPDGSLKWVLLTFPVDVSQAVAVAPAPRVSLRNGKFLPVTITQEKSTSAPAQSVLKVEAKGNRSAKIINGDWNVEFVTGTQWLRSLRYKNHSLLHDSKQPRQAYSDYLLEPSKVLPFEREAQGGRHDEGVLNVDKVEVEEAGPLRAVVRLEGLTNNQEATRIILRIEILAGRPELRITHTAEFRFKDPRQTFLTGLGLELPVGAEKPDESGETTLTLQLSQDHRETRIKEGATWQQISQENAHRGWAQLENGELKITGITRNFQRTAPKGMAVNSQAGVLRFELWPEEAGPMDVRRYSNYPHRSQGESVRDEESWVEEIYYPEDPFVGITRSHELLLSFQPDADTTPAESLAADFQSPPLLYAGWENYQATGVVLPAPFQKEWPRAWQAWTNLATFWLWHQKLYQWNGFWSFGDIRHLYQTGYGTIVSPEALVEHRPWEKPNVKLPRESTRRDYQPPNDWAYDNGRWGWGNTEGLPNLFLQQEYLRHGNRAVYFAAEALARHGRDVVTRHEGKWFGKGTRHGVQHWSDGNHEERQTTITEYRLHYFLSGDGRSRDTINKLYEDVYSKTPVAIHAAHSGRLGGLLFHWEITGSQEEAKQLKRYIDLFLSPEGIYISPQVAFPGPKASAAPRDLNSGNMFFHYFGGTHALIEYQQITGDPKLAAAIIKMADAAMTDPDVQRRYRTGKNGGFWPIIAFAALHAADPAPYQQFMAGYIKTGGWQNMYQTVTKNPEHWSGDTGYMSSSVPGTWFWANWAPYVAQSLGNSEIWTPEIEEELHKIEESGNPNPRMRPSWQSEYDGISELEEYLGTQKPWK